MTHWKMLKLLALVLPVAACSSPDSNGNSASEPQQESAAETTPEQATGRVFIVSPANGAELSSPVTVVFGIEGFAVAPAGTYEPATGHHHLLIDTGLPALDQPVPADANHVHFGKGQTETTVELTPGEHTLQLLLGDGNHVPHNPPLTSEVVMITVVE